MISKSLSTPVLFLVFNRPDVTQRVFDVIKIARPERLYVAADGPRDLRPDDKEKCEATRNIIRQVDWDCKVVTLFRDKNLGCKVAVSSAIDWFFENEEEGIILKDDCLPSNDFFRLCSHLLERYRFDNRIMHISGNNFQDGITRGNASYYFSNVLYIWGWASWRRAWEYYNLHLPDFDEILDRSLLNGVVSSPLRRSKSIFHLKKAKEGHVNTWDYQWLFAMWRQHGLAITPNKNLTVNIGFNEEAVHTKSKQSSYLGVKAFPLGEIKDSELMMPDTIADAYFMDRYYGRLTPFYRYLRSKVLKY